VKLAGASQDAVVRSVRYESGKLWINDAQWFEGVDEAEFGARIGGYAPCAKWLKDRVGRVLTAEEIAHYRRIVGAMRATRETAVRIDAAIDAAGGWPIA
jgi:hypothetical protein